MIDLEAIETRATLKRWPTQAELGQLQGDNKDLIARIRELEAQQSSPDEFVRIQNSQMEILAKQRNRWKARAQELEATVTRVREAFHPELGKLCADCLWEVETILDGTP